MTLRRQGLEAGAVESLSLVVLGCLELMAMLESQLYQYSNLKVLLVVMRIEEVQVVVKEELNLNLMVVEHMGLEEDSSVD